MGANRVGGIESRVVDGRGHLVLSGEIDVARSYELGQASRALETCTVPVQIDMAGATFVDSAALAMLARLRVFTGAKPCLIDPSPMVLFILELTELGDFLDVCPATAAGASPAEITSTSTGQSGGQCRCRACQPPSSPTW